MKTETDEILEILGINNFLAVEKLATQRALSICDAVSFLLHPFLPRDAMLARHMLSPCVRLSARLSVRLSQAGVALKRLDESSWFLAPRLPSINHRLCYKKICVSPNISA